MGHGASRAASASHFRTYPFDWVFFEHYFYYPKDKTPLRKQRPTVLVDGGESVPLDVPKQRTMEKIVEKLLILEGITSGRKEFD